AYVAIGARLPFAGFTIWPASSCATMATECEGRYNVNRRRQPRSRKRRIAMGLFDSLVSGALRGVLGEGQSQALLGLLSKVLGGTELGSISGLLAQLQQGGLDRQVASWLGNGANMAVRPDQLRAALGEERLQQIGSAAGVSTDTLLGALA